MKNLIKQKHSHFTMIPNIIDDLGLTAQAFRLYYRVARRSGSNLDAACWENTKSLAKTLRMSKSTIIRAKQELLDAKLITITEKKNPNGGEKYHEISLVELWEINKDFFYQGTR
jgi:hypothetical protein